MRRRLRRAHGPSVASLRGRFVSGCRVVHVLDADRPLGLVDEKKPAGRERTAVDVKIDWIVGAPVEADDRARGETDCVRKRQGGAAELGADAHTDRLDRLGGEDRLQSIEYLIAAL